MDVLHDPNVVYLTSQELASILRVGTAGLLKQTKRGEIPGAVKPGAIWLYRREVIVGWLAERERAAAEGVASCARDA